MMGIHATASFKGMEMKDFSETQNLLPTTKKIDIPSA